MGQVFLAQRTTPSQQPANDQPQAIGETISADTDVIGQPPIERAATIS
jgi:hypothetical protein